MTAYTDYQTRHAELSRLEKLARENVHTCGATLSVAIKEGISTLRCGRCNQFVGENELVKRRSLTRQYQDGEILNPAIVNRIEAKEEKKMAQEIGVDKARQLAPFRQVSALTREQATEVLLTIWPGASEVAVIKAAMICAQYHLNPLMKHVSLLCFNKGKPNETWEPAIGIKANRLMGCRKGTYSYLDNTPRIMTEAEQKTINGEIQPDRIWAIVKLRDEKTGACVQGTGFWPRDKDIQGADKGNTKQNMAQIHAERQAIDRLRPGEMPSDVEVFDEQYSARIIEVPRSEPGTRSVNPRTGEIETRISVDEDGVIDEDVSEQTENAPVTKQDDKDPLKSWTGTSKPRQATEQVPETAETTNRTGQTVKVPPVQPIKATEEQQNRLRELLGDNYQKFHVEIQKRHNCYPSEMTTELAATYIQQIAKKLKEAT